MRGQYFALIWIICVFFIYLVIVFGSAAISEASSGNSVDYIRSMLSNPQNILMAIVLSSILTPICYCCGKTQE